MPSEITAYLQTQTQTHGSTNSQSYKENSQPGLFDSFMSEYVSGKENTADQNSVISTGTHEDTAQLITFTGTNSLSQSVIDILAGIPQEIQDTLDDIAGTLKDSGGKIHSDLRSITESVKSLVSEKIGALKSELPNDINGLVSQILNDESISEETRNEIMNALDDLVKSIADSELADENVKSFAVKISDMIYEHINTREVPSEKENNSDSEDTEEAADISESDALLVSTAGAALNSGHADTVNASECASAIPESAAQSEIPHTNQSSQQNAHARNVTHDTKPQNENENEAVNHETESANFDEHLEISENENENSNRNNNPSGHEENSSGHEHTNDNSDGTHQITSRSRNDSRRTSGSSSRTQDERTESNSHRTESHNTFQSFFEGVLSSRRNASRTSSTTPLNLQTASYSLNQSQTLRDGMINVVRFIRADGVQKANVVIDPPALGRISVELSSTSSGVEASIKVASEQIRQLVQDQLSELRMNLSQQGVQVAEFTVDVQQDNSQNGNHQGSHYENERRTFAITEADDETEEFRIDLEEGLLYWVA